MSQRFKLINIIENHSKKNYPRRVSNASLIGMLSSKLGEVDELVFENFFG